MVGVFAYWYVDKLFTLSSYALLKRLLLQPMLRKLGLITLVLCLTFAVGFDSNGATTTKTDYVVSDSEGAFVTMPEAHTVIVITCNEFDAGSVLIVLNATDLPSGYDVFVDDNRGMFIDPYSVSDPKPKATVIGKRFKPPQVLRC